MMPRKHPEKPKRLSPGEEAFALHCRVEGLTPEREYKFCLEHGRRFRFDFAWPKLKIAVEIEGGIWSGGRHTTAQGFRMDCTKYNLAASLGWRIFRYPTDLVASGEAIEQVLGVISEYLPRTAPRAAGEQEEAV